MSVSQDQASRKLDKLIASSVLQIGVSIAYGAVASLIFFKRKSWPVLVGAGFGTGAAYADIISGSNRNS